MRYQCLRLWPKQRPVGGGERIGPLWRPRMMVLGDDEIILCHELPHVEVKLGERRTQGLGWSIKRWERLIGDLLVDELLIH